MEAKQFKYKLYQYFYDAKDLHDGFDELLKLDDSLLISIENVVVSRFEIEYNDKAHKSKAKQDVIEMVIDVVIDHGKLFTNFDLSSLQRSNLYERVRSVFTGFINERRNSGDLKDDLEKLSDMHASY